ncbi:sensor histidine kinase [Gordonia mangrovi]
MAGNEEVTTDRGTLGESVRDQLTREVDSGTLRDPVVVTTVLGNLVDNAIDACALDDTKHGVVEVEVITDGNDLLISVADFGPGIPCDDPEEILIEGMTTKSAATVPGGRGMGLALSRQMARRGGGDIWVADPGDDGGGALPVARLREVFDAAEVTNDGSDAIR